MSVSNRRIAVIGGGAAGFFAAIHAAQADTAAQVVIYEATNRPLDKVRISGGGRCNVTHHCFDPVELIKYYPRGSRELRGPFSRFQPQDTVTWFQSRGVKLKTETDGRMFPVTDNSETIIECLQQEIRKLKVTLRTGARVTAVTRDSSSSQFAVSANKCDDELYDAVILTTGSSTGGHKFAEALGHTIVACVPSLFTFKINDPRLQDLAGISFDRVTARLPEFKPKSLTQSGPLLITHWGLSGPAVLRLSAWGARELHDCKYNTALHIDFVPEISQEVIREMLTDRSSESSKKRVSNVIIPGIPHRYWLRVLDYVNAPEDRVLAELKRAELDGLVSELKSASFAISGKGVFKEEFVTCGGVDLKEVDFRTMQSRVCPGLYLAGEVLNIDGVTGGFNFQSAWTTGWIAGQSAAELPQ